MEYMVLGLFVLLLINIGLGGVFFCLLYIGFRACEGALGLAILVAMRRTHGGDSFNLFSLSYDKDFDSYSREKCIMFT